MPPKKKNKRTGKKPAAKKSTITAGYAFHNTIRSHSNDVEMVKAAFNKNPKAVMTKDNNGDLPLHVAIHFQASFEVLKFLLEAFPQSAFHCDGQQRYPLHLLVRPHFPIDVVKLFIEAVKSVHDYGHILHTAIHWNISLDVLEALYDAFPKSIETRNKESELPLFHAIKNQCSLETIQFLLEKDANEYGVNFKKNGMNSLQYAVYHHRNLDVIQAIFHARPEAMRERFADGSNVMHLAVDCDPKLSSFDLVQFIVEKYPESVKETTEIGSLPLHVAAGRNASIPTLCLLISQYPQAVSMENEIGNIPAIIAMKNNASVDKFQLLLSDIKEQHYDGLLQCAMTEKSVSSEVFRMVMLSYQVKNPVEFMNGLTILQVALQNNKLAPGDLCQCLSMFPDCLNETLVSDDFIPNGWSIVHHGSGNYAFQQVGPLIPKNGGYIVRTLFGKTTAESINNQVHNKPIHSLALFGTNSEICSILKHLENAMDNWTGFQFISLSNQQIGDQGAELLAAVSKKCVSKHEICIQNCGIGIPGLDKLIKSAEANKDDQNRSRLRRLDLSHNPGVCNKKGGEMIGQRITAKTNTTTFVVMGRVDSGDVDYDEFVDTLTSVIRMNPKSSQFWQLNGLQIGTIQAMEYFRSPLHLSIMKFNCQRRLMNDPNQDKLWPHIFEQVNQTISKTDNVFYYTRCIDGFPEEIAVTATSKSGESVPELRGSGASPAKKASHE